VIYTDDACVPAGCVLQPGVVLRFEAAPTSKSLQQYLDSLRSARVMVVDPGGWREPSNRATDVLHVQPRLLCEALSALVQRSTASAWLEEWLRLNAVTRRALERHLTWEDDLFEGKVFSLLAELLPEDALIFAGNSMPVRD